MEGPVLGSIPLVGRLFQSTSDTQTRNRFFVFLRCSVLRNTQFEDLRYLSAPERAAAGVEDGWPMLEPRVIQ